MIAIDPVSERRYILKAERGLPPEEQSVFILRPLTLRESNAIEDMTVGVGEGDGMTIRSGSVRTRALEYGLIGWENVLDSKGNEVPFDGTRQKRGGVEFISPNSKTLERLPRSVQHELAEAITTGSDLTEEEAGNSSASGSEPSAGTD